MWRAIRAIGYWFSSLFSGVRRFFMGKTAVLAVGYDDAAKAKGAHVEQLTQATVGLKEVAENKKSRLKELAAQIATEEQRVQGAAILGRQLVVKYNGDAARVQADPDYREAALVVQKSTEKLTTMKAERDRVEGELTSITDRITTNKALIQQKLREVQEIRNEKKEAIASIEAARQEEAAAKLVNGIPDDTSDQLLQEMRSIRQEAEMRSNIQKELAGNALDAVGGKDKFLALAQGTQSNSSFDALIGLSAPKPLPALPQVVQGEVVQGEVVSTGFLPRSSQNGN